MRSSVKFNYGCVQGGTVSQPIVNRDTIYTFSKQPTQYQLQNRQVSTPISNSPSYKLQSTPLSQLHSAPLNQVQSTHFNQVQSRPQTQIYSQTNYIQELQRNPGNQLKLQGIPDANEEDFKPGCFSSALSGIVYKSKEQ